MLLFRLTSYLFIHWLVYKIDDYGFILNLCLTFYFFLSANLSVLTFYYTKFPYVFILLTKSLFYSFIEVFLYEFELYIWQCKLCSEYLPKNFRIFNSFLLWFNIFWLLIVGLIKHNLSYKSILNYMYFYFVNRFWLANSPSFYYSSSYSSS